MPDLDIAESLIRLHDDTERSLHAAVNAFVRAVANLLETPVILKKGNLANAKEMHALGYEDNTAVVLALDVLVRSFAQGKHSPEEANDVLKRIEHIITNVILDPPAHLRSRFPEKDVLLPLLVFIKNAVALRDCCAALLQNPVALAKEEYAFLEHYFLVLFKQYNLALKPRVNVREVLHKFVSEARLAQLQEEFSKVRSAYAPANAS